MRITGLLQSSVTGAEPVASTKSKISTEYDGKRRRLYATNCVVCEKEFWAPRNALLKQNRRCCGPECRGINSRNRISLKCSGCGLDFERRKAHTRHATNGFHFCSRSCKDKAQRIEGIKAIHPQHYSGGGSFYRERAFRFYGKKCVDCGYDTDERMLDVDHEDGNRENAAIENLKPRCVWCHALKTRGVPNHARI